MSFHNCPHCNRKYKTKPKYESHVISHDKTPGKTNYALHLRKSTKLRQLHYEKYLEKEKQSRNYNIEPPSKIFLLCPVKNCKRKYKSEERVKKHVEEKHFYNTRNQNWKFNFNKKTKANIYELAAKYAKVIHRISKMNEQEVIDIVKSNPDDEMIMYAKNLLPQKYGKKINTEELTRIAIAQHKFSRRIINENLLGRCNWTDIIIDLEAFFRLGLPYYDTNFCPTLPIDFLWHSLMQDPKLYKKICKESCGEIIPHCSILRSDEEDINRYEYFLKVYEHRYKQDVCLPSDNSDNADDQQYFVQQFTDLCLKEREKIANKERKKQEKLLEYKRIQNEIMREFSEKAGVDVSYWSNYLDYLPLYKEGFTGEKLRQLVYRKIQDSRSMMASSC